MTAPRCGWSTTPPTCEADRDVRAVSRCPRPLGRALSRQAPGVERTGQRLARRDRQFDDGPYVGCQINELTEDGAKLAMVALCRHFARHRGALIDCQMQNPFLATLGIEEWPRSRFLAELARLGQQPLLASCWQEGEISL